MAQVQDHSGMNHSWLKFTTFSTLWKILTLDSRQHAAIKKSETQKKIKFHPESRAQHV